MSYVDEIIDDVYTNGRLFLPGGRPSQEVVRKHLEIPILVDGLDAEESALILSALPEHATRIYLSPLDKGLSGSKVFAAKYDPDGTRLSKVFVMKLGPRNKIEREANAIQELVAPHVGGVGQPIFRRTAKKALVVQELAGLSKNSSLTSLRLFARTSQADRTVYRLFENRLGDWYLIDRAQVDHRLGDLFRWYLSKVDGKEVFPTDWTALQTWVADLCGCPWEDPSEFVTELGRLSVRSIPTIVHGDLHSQNVIVDDQGETWPIDFAWCHDNASPLLDLTMLECSLKFLSIPARSDLRTLIRIEQYLVNEPYPNPRIGTVPYCTPIANVLHAVRAIRRVSEVVLRISFKDYQRALTMMTYSLSNHPDLNRPYVLASLQILRSMDTLLK